MKILNTLFRKEIKRKGRAIGNLYRDDHLLQPKEIVTKTEEAPILRLDVLEPKKSPAFLEVVKTAEEDIAMSPSATQLRPDVLEPKKSPALLEVVKATEEDIAMSPSTTQLRPAELVIDPQHPLALREVMKFVEFMEGSMSPSTKQLLKIVLVLDTRPRLEPGNEEKAVEEEDVMSTSTKQLRPSELILDTRQPLESPELVKVEEQYGWTSPSYTHSRSVVLNPERLLANRCVGYMCGSYESESYKVLRTRIIQKTGQQGGTTVMITSALPGEGKTLTAINLSLTFAKEYSQTVLLVDSDLRQQRVHKYLGFKSYKGLADYLLKGTNLSDLIVWPGVEKFTVISGGKTVLASSELLNSPRMKELVKDLKSRYPERYVFFDVAPVLAGADAQAFAPLVDYIVLVVQAGSTSIADIKLALDMLPREKVLGVVLNRAKQPGMTKKYYYGYEKNGKSQRNIKNK
jgi:protein-tyrosine kinase